MALCIASPEKLALGIENYIGIIDRQIKALSSSGLPPEQLEQTDIGLVLLAGLQATFPCVNGAPKNRCSVSKESQSDSATFLYPCGAPEKAVRDDCNR